MIGCGCLGPVDPRDVDDDPACVEREHVLADAVQPRLGLSSSGDDASLYHVHDASPAGIKVGTLGGILLDGSSTVREPIAVDLGLDGGQTEDCSVTLITGCGKTHPCLQAYRTRRPIPIGIPVRRVLQAGQRRSLERMKSGATARAPRVPLLDARTGRGDAS